MITTALHHLHEAISTCRKCPDAGYFAQSSDVVIGMPVTLPRMMLVGQAPAASLRSKGLPFSGQAGRVLFRWLAQAGFSEDDFRANCYFTAITKCYPGPARNGPGSGDRAPSTAERRMCRPFLERELELVQPRLVLAVGRIAIEYFLGPLDLATAVGSTFNQPGRTIVPLPHPSGVSRWTNAPDNRARLDRALRALADLRL
ncbi:MAG: uracil-DNA glycosylase family protein [Chloroflexi bacterium]|nr:uracil-DNA glycosylase family protein [Chloroflexota bacterium]